MKKHSIHQAINTIAKTKHCKVVMKNHYLVKYGELVD